MPRTKHKSIKLKHTKVLVNERSRRITDAISNGKEREEQGRVIFNTGATRCSTVAGDAGEFPLRYDLFLDNTEAIKRIARTYGEGSLKYPDRNWMRGLPEDSLINHALAHIVQHRDGDTTEDHLAHAVWNLMTLMWVQKNRPELLVSAGPGEAA